MLKNVGRHVKLAALFLLHVGQDVSAQQKLVLHSQSLHADCNAIILNITAFDRQLTFVADTGSSTHVFDKTFSGQLGARIAKASGDTPLISVEMELFVAPKMQVGSVTLETTLPVTIADLSIASDKLGIHLDGILGTEFFMNNIVDVNWPKRRVEFIAEVTTTTSYRFTALTLQQEGFHVNGFGLNLAPNDINMTIDTGARMFACLETSLFDTLVESGRIAKVLLEYGVNPNAMSALDDTPIHCCLCNANAEMIDLLISNGAESHYTTELGETIFDNWPNNSEKQSRLVAVLQKHNVAKTLKQQSNRP